MTEDPRREKSDENMSIAKTNTGVSKTIMLTLLAMTAFAANSLLGRIALGQYHIDPASFTAIRVLSGALVLGLIVLPKWRAQGHLAVDWRSASMLFVYMAFFSFAYLSLDTGTGALVLFAAVQLTMFIFALRAGERFAFWAWVGFAMAIAGLVYLLFPGITAPDPLGALLMVVAGIAWGGYSLVGKQVDDPLLATASNFLCALPFVAITSLVFIDQFHISATGLALAIASGAVTSGLGYAIWYAALGGLSASRAATVQLSVPIIAAFGGALVLSEHITSRLLLASALSLGGIALVLIQRQRQI